MALWDRVIKLSQDKQEQIQLFYADNFPIEVRYLLADWIEERLLNAPLYLPKEENVYKQDPAIFLNELIVELERRASNLVEKDLATTVRLTDAANNIRYQLERNPLQLYNNLLYCLDRERQYVANSQELVNMQELENMQELVNTQEIVNIEQELLNMQEPAVAKMFNELKQLQDMEHTNESVNRKLTRDYEYLQYKLQQQQAHTLEDTEMSMHAQNQHVQHEKEIHDCQQGLIDKRQALVDRFRKTVFSTNMLLNTVLDLLQCKINPRYFGNGASRMTDSHLDTVQAWCESLVKIIWNTKSQIKLAMRNHSMLHMNQEAVSDPLSQDMIDLIVMQKKLIDNSFIIEKQPPQVIKTHVRFNAGVRFLIGNMLKMKPKNPQVEVSIISEAQAQQTLQTNIASEQPCGVILNSVRNLKCKESTKKFSASFTGILLEKILRSEKAGTECVTDEKYALLFKTSFALDPFDLVYPVWTISLPVVVIVHGNQLPLACATITWDTLSALEDSVPFKVVERVPWNLMAEILIDQFRDSTGRPLTAQNIHMLCEQAAGRALPFPEPNDMTISWSQFCKEALPGRPYTFYEWFFAAMKLTMEHLYKPWKDGSIIGFIHKSKAVDFLLKCPPGTFLLRFSDSVLGGITIAWVHQSSQGQLQILHIQPFTAKDLSIRTLSERIHDIDDLLFLYPDKPKQEAFSGSVAPVVPWHNNNYIPTELRTVLIPFSNNELSNNFSSTAPYNIQLPDTNFCDSLSVSEQQIIENE